MLNPKSTDTITSHHSPNRTDLNSKHQPSLLRAQPLTRPPIFIPIQLPPSTLPPIESRFLATVHLSARPLTATPPPGGSGRRRPGPGLLAPFPRRYARRCRQRPQSPPGRLRLRFQHWQRCLLSITPIHPRRALPHEFSVHIQRPDVNAPDQPPVLIPGLLYHPHRLVGATGVSLAGIRDLSGHRSVVTTERCAHLAPDNIREAVVLLEQSRFGHGANTDPVSMPRGEAVTN